LPAKVRPAAGKVNPASGLARRDLTLREIVTKVYCGAGETV
jgi:hypothetical protein